MRAPAAGRGWWLAAPALAVILSVVLYPLVFATYYSLREVRPNLVGDWSGLSNYSRMLHDPGFLGALSTTLAFTAASSTLSLVLGFSIALALNRVTKGRGALTAIFLIPWAFALVVVATISRLLVNDQVGIVGYAVKALGILDQPLLTDPPALLVVAILADVWRGTPLVVLLLLAGLSTIPAELHEAASVDGAGSLQRFFRITVPLLRPTLPVVLLFRALDAFRVYDLFWVMSGRQLESISTYIYENVMISQFNFGLGMAGAVFVFECALSTAAVFIALFGAQASTGLQHSGLYERGRSGPGGRLLPYAVLAPAALAFAAPPLWVLKMSLVSPRELLSTPPDILPNSLSIFPYLAILGNGAFLLSLANSTLIAGTVTLLTLLLGTPAAYAISRLGLRHGNRMLAGMLAVSFFPPVAVLAPMLIQLGAFGLANSYLAVILPNTAFLLPLAIWLLSTFFRELPADVEEAARACGATTFQVLRKVTVPLAAPSVLAAGALIFILAWNEFIFANTFLFDPGLRPVTVLLAGFAGTVNPNYGLLAASSLVATLPPVLLILAIQRRLVPGPTGGQGNKKSRGA